MKKRILAFILIFALVAGFCPAMAEEDTGRQTLTYDGGDYDGYIVKLRDDLIMPMSLSMSEHSIGFGMYVVDTMQEALALAGPSAVDNIGPNLLFQAHSIETPNDRFYDNGEQWNFNFVYTGELWTVSKGANTTVAVIDTGVMAHDNPATGEFLHEDFEESRIADGFNTVDNNANTKDTGGHGTAVASVIAATANNEIGIAGIAPEAKIAPYMVFGTGGAAIADLISAMNRIKNDTDSTVDVVNMSLGMPFDVDYSNDFVMGVFEHPENYNLSGGWISVVNLMRAIDAVIDAGKIVIVSSGNDGDGTNNTEVPRNVISVPAFFPNVISVGALNSTGRIAGYSTYNKNVWIAAPGTGIKCANYNGPHLYDSMSGTSLSAPLVSAFAAIAKSNDPNINQNEFKNLLRMTANYRDDAGDYDDYTNTPPTTGTSTAFNDGSGQSRNEHYGYGTVDGSRMANAMEQHTVTYNLGYDSDDEGEDADVIAYNYYVYQNRTITAPTPTREGYTFEGWYSDSGLTTKVTPSAVSLPMGEYGSATNPYTAASNVTYYAKWLSDDASLTSVTVAYEGGSASAEKASAANTWTVTTPADTEPARVSVVTGQENATVAFAHSGGAIVGSEEDEVWTAAVPDGVYAITATVTPESGETNSVTHTINITTPHAPAVVGDSAVSRTLLLAAADGSSEAQTFEIADVRTLFSDADGDVESYALGGYKLDGEDAVSIDGLSLADNKLIFAPTADHAGKTASFTLTATDAAGLTASIAYTMAVKVPNSAPALTDTGGVYDKYAYASDHTAPTARVSAYDNAMALSTADGALTLNTDYTVAAGVVTFGESWLESLSTGVTTVTFTFTAGADHETPGEAGTADYDLTVKDTTPVLTPDSGSFDTFEPDDLAFTFNSTSAALSSIVCGTAGLAEDTDYTASNDSSTHVCTVTLLKDGWLGQQTPGEPLELTVNFDNGDAKTYTLTVTDGTPTPAITPTSGVFDKYKPADLTFKFQTGMATLASIKIGSTALTSDADYTLEGDETYDYYTVTLKKSVFANKSTGTVAVTLTFSNGDTAEFTVTVKNTTPSGGGGGSGGGNTGGGSTGGSSGGSSGSGSGSSGGSSSGGSTASTGKDKDKTTDKEVKPAATETSVKKAVDGRTAVTVGDGSKLSDKQSAEIVAANSDSAVVIDTDAGLRMVVPAGTLTAGADLREMLPDTADAKAGDIVVFTDESGRSEVVTLALVEDGKATFVADRVGSYTIESFDADYTDTASHWGASAISFVSARSLCNGMGDGRFEPTRTTSRAMILTILARLSGADTTPPAGGRWYDGVVNWAVARGYTDGTRPSDEITREELVALLWRSAGRPDVGKLEGFKDVGEVSLWANRAMAWAVDAGILQGRPDGTVDPHAKANRAEMATFVQRYIAYLVKQA